MKAENNPYFKNQYKPSPLWRTVILKLCISLVRCFWWFVSLFTNKPVAIDGISAWYWVRGKRKSMYDLIKEYYDNTRNKK